VRRLLRPPLPNQECTAHHQETGQGPRQKSPHREVPHIGDSAQTSSIADASLSTDAAAPAVSEHRRCTARSALGFPPVKVAGGSPGEHRQRPYPPRKAMASHLLEALASRLEQLGHAAPPDRSQCINRPTLARSAPAFRGWPHKAAARPRCRPQDRGVEVVEALLHADAITSEAIEQTGQPSSATTRRLVLARLSSTSAVSSGRSVRRSITSASIPRPPAFGGFERKADADRIADDGHVAALAHDPRLADRQDMVVELGQFEERP
jgi:hypothetical protein